MRLSNKTEYGLRALIYLGEHQDKGAVSLGTIASDEDISVFFLEKIFAVLKAGDLVKAVRGKHGGYVISQPLSAISLKDVIVMLEEDVEPVGDLATQTGHAKIHCKSHIVLSVVHNKILESMSGVHLSDLCSV